MLALVIQVVREMVFTLGKWSFAKKAGKCISCSIRAATKGLGSKSKGWIHSILVTEGQQEVRVLRLLPRALRGLIKNYQSPVWADPERRGSLPGQEVEQRRWTRSGTYWKRRVWRVTAITNQEQCEWLCWTSRSVALSNVKSMTYELDSFI